MLSKKKNNFFGIAEVFDSKIYFKRKEKLRENRRKTEKKEKKVR